MSEKAGPLLYSTAVVYSIKNHFILSLDIKDIKTKERESINNDVSAYAIVGITHKDGSLYISRPNTKSLFSLYPKLRANASPKPICTKNKNKDQNLLCLFSTDRELYITPINKTEITEISESNFEKIFNIDEAETYQKIESQEEKFKNNTVENQHP